MGNLPLVGPLFRNESDATRRQEIIILLTPHIVKDDDAMSALAEKAQKDAEKLRVGVRKGMMFWGRERLADMYYQCAVDELAKYHPDRKKAIWTLDAPVNLVPTSSEPIQLRQQLTGKEIAAADGSTVRSFVRKAILDDRTPAKPVALLDEGMAPTTAPASS